jgi:hypothetical protein
LENKFCGDWVTYQTPTDRIKAMNQITATIDELKGAGLNQAAQIDTLLQSPIFDYNRDRFFKTLEEDGIYGRRFVRYLLFKLDVLYASSDTRLQAPKWMSVEHVLPQNPQSDSQWCKDFSEEEREAWTHRLGNLILLGRRKNSSQGRRDYKDKKERYFKNNIEIFPNSVRAMQAPTWDLESLQVNHRDVLKQLRAYA